MKYRVILRTLFIMSFMTAIQADDSDATNSNCCSKICSQSQNLFHPRARSAYLTSETLLIKPLYMNHQKRDEWNGTVGFSFDYMQNFGQKCDSCKSLGALPFWSGTSTMTYGTNDGESDLDAYQFGMGDVEGQGSITLTPKIMHVSADTLLYFVQHKENRGFFFSLRAPLGAMSVTTNLKETIAPGDETKNEATNAAWLSYPSAGNRYTSLTEAWQSGSANSDVVQSSLHKPLALEKGRMAACRQTSIRFADLSAVLGYNFYASENGFIGIGAKFSCPTGTVSTGKYVLEPIYGRAGHWGIGAQLQSHYIVWCHDTKDRQFDIWVQGEVQHLRTGRTPNYRSFDLKQNGLGSKYMLIQYYFAGNPTDDNPTGRISSFITNAVNVTTMPVKSVFNVEGSASIILDFTANNWNIALGGDFWARSKEKLSIDCCRLVDVNAANLNDFAVLGRQISDDAHLFDSTQPVSDSNYIAPISLCEPLATINKSLARVEVDSIDPTALPMYDTEKIKDARDAANRIPAKLSDALDICGAQAGRAMTARVFGQVGYTFVEHRYSPYVAVNGGAEFAPGKTNNAINLWSVGAQGSISF